MRNPTSDGWGIASIEAPARAGHGQCLLVVLACSPGALAPAPHRLVSATVFTAFGPSCGLAALPVLTARPFLETAGLAAARGLCTRMIGGWTRPIGSGGPGGAIIALITPWRGLALRRRDPHIGVALATAILPGRTRICLMPM